MKNLLLCALTGALTGALLCTPALAQQPAQQRQGAGQNNAAGAGGNAVFQLPPSIQNVVSIDALNMIIIASDGQRPGETQYTPSIIQHVYSGGIARLFGGTAVPTAQFATPGLMNGAQNGGNGNSGNSVGGFGGNQNGVSNFGGNNNGGGQNGFGGNNNGGFGGGGFGSAILRGNGFNTQNGNVIVNARVRTR